MPVLSLDAMKQQCVAEHQAWAAASADTLQLLTEVDVPIEKELRGSLLHHLQVEHQAQERYLAARQAVLQFVQEHFRRP